VASGSFADGSISSVAILGGTNYDVSKFGTGGAIITEDVMGHIVSGTIYEGATPRTADTAKSHFISMPDYYANGKWYEMDDYSSWGYWKAESSDSNFATFGFWVGGAKTIPAEIPGTGTAEYNGYVAGAVAPISGGGAIDLIALDQHNHANFNINFGSGTPVSGTLNFNTMGGQAWAVTVGSAGSSIASATSSFSASTVGGTVNTTTAITSGSVNGMFYGPGAASIGGAFKANAGTQQASGVFKAKQLVGLP